VKDHLLSLLKKYDVPAPRYTSYPTVPMWKTEVGPAEYQKSLGSLQPNEKLSLYFHIPFCEKLCHFCGCMQVITSDHSRSAPYLQTLLQEVAQVVSLLSSQSQEVVQLHLGGGTPNFLQPEELEKLISTVRRSFTVSSKAELAIEMHPRTSTVPFCEKLAELGFNRISLGVQDFDPTVQRLINRHQTYEKTVEMILLLRKLGFCSFNFDLIYGLPGQTVQGWKDTLKKVIKLRPNRLAVYSYAHVPWVKPVQRSFKDADLPPPEMKLELFQIAYETFLQKGYRHIGMDHFALQEDELSQALDVGTIHRNFMGYSTQAEAHQIGFGVSAISYVGQNYFQNKKKLPHYEAMIQKKNFATFRGYLLGQEDKIRRDLITQIMCRGKVNFQDFRKKWDIDFEKYFFKNFTLLQSLEESGLIHIHQNGFEAKQVGLLFLRNIATIFDNFLPEVSQKKTQPIFSRTV
jgi:oxygen-independent coproporphyrinogen-3 oxidase